MKAGESEAKSMMKDKAESYGSGTKDAMKDKAKDASYGSGTKDAMKDKAKDASYGSGAKAEDVMMKEKNSSYGSGGTVKSAPNYGSGTTTATTTAAPAINCPFGTTAQANGTCMITGNYVPRS